ncbi:hypothetical protein [Longimicrobium sp.]|uniref:hypothetical protein n=1 Tax=Longimicrobium sp. TaxID=2029185 RepID=UPI003B3ACC3E
MTCFSSRPGLALTVALGVSGWGACTARPPAAAAVVVACVPTDGQLVPGARADVLSGDFRLTLTADRGPRTGSSATGTLRLQAFGSRPVPVPPAEGVRYPLFGGTDVALDSVGALVPGAVDRADAARPGVLVLEWPRPGAPSGSNQIMLRLGADANQGGPPRFDGAFTALTVTALDADRFAGRWQSGGGDREAAGYFCAERIASGG